MEVSKLSFTKKTQDKMKKNMSVREKGKVLFARLQELEADGTLSKAKTRADVARLVGYPEERAKAGYAWISNLIRRGHVNRRKAKKQAGQELRRWQDKVAAGYIPQAPEPQVYDEKQVAGDTKIMTPIKIEITRGNMTIKVEMDSHEEASKLITTIMKGE